MNPHGRSKSAWIVAIVLLLLASPAWAGIETIGTLPGRLTSAAYARHIVTLPNGGIVGIGDIETATAAIDASAPVMSSSWQSGPMTHTVNTPRLKGENADHQAQRHLQAVVALASVFPPVITVMNANPGLCYVTSWLAPLVGQSSPVTCTVVTPCKGTDPIGQPALHGQAVTALYALMPAA